MATSTWSTVLDHTTDAGFRAWGSELSANLAAIGLVQTADTGQINWSTVTRAAATTDAGYEIWRFNDTLQSTCPVYIKVLYGTGLAANARLGFQIGSATNGAGAFTTGGNTIPYYTYSLSGLAGTTQTATARSSYISCSNNFFGLVHKISGYGSGSSISQISVSRTSNTTGIFTSNGITSYMTSATGSTNAWIKNGSTANSAATYTTAGYCVIPYLSNYTTSTVTTLSSPNPRAFLHWSSVDGDIQPLISHCTVNSTEFGSYSTFSTTLFGSTSHTYLKLPYASGQGWPEPDTSASASFGIAMLWE